MAATDNTAVSYSQTWRNGLRIMSASVAAQVSAIVLSPAVARLYTPDEMGVFGLFLAIVGIVTTLSTGRFEQAIMVEKSDERCGSLFLLCTGLCFATSVCVAIVCAVAGNSAVATWFNTPGMAEYVPVIAPLVFLSAFAYTLTYVFNRQNKFNLTARYTATQGIGNNVLKIVFSPFAGGLYIANVAGQIIGIASVMGRSANPFARLRSRLECMPGTARRHWRFPVFNLPHALINTIAGNLPIMILAYAFPTQTVGCFAMCMTFGYKPVNVFARSTNQAFFHSASRNRLSGSDYGRFLRRFVWRVSLIIVPVAVGLYAVMPAVTSVLFGEGWDDTCGIMRALMPVFVASLLSVPLSFVPSMLDKQGHEMALEMVSAVARTVALIVGATTGDIIVTATLFSVTHAVFLVVQLGWYLWLIRRDERGNSVFGSDL